MVKAKRRPKEKSKSANVVEKASDVAKAAITYYDLRRELLIKEHEEKSFDRKTKMEWKKEEHMKKMKLIEDQQAVLRWPGYYDPQNPTSSMSNPQFQFTS